MFLKVDNKFRMGSQEHTIVFTPKNRCMRREVATIATTSTADRSHLVNVHIRRGQLTAGTDAWLVINIGRTKGHKCYYKNNLKSNKNCNHREIHIE